MAATQDADVLLKQVCQKHGSAADKEPGYRSFFLQHYKNQGIQAVEILMPRYDLAFAPFANWGNSRTPEWWKANNKVKHQRHEYFQRASLQNTLNAFAALFIANTYHASERGDLANNRPGSRLLQPKAWWKSEGFGADGTVFHLPDFRPKK
jgi:hypothetical protein